MECHVLIPDSLMLMPRPLSGCSSPSVARLLEQEIMVGTRVPIPKGTKFHSLEGTVKFGKLDVYSTLPEDDVSIMIIFIEARVAR